MKIDKRDEFKDFNKSIKFIKVSEQNERHKKDFI